MRRGALSRWPNGARVSCEMPAPDDAARRHRRAEDTARWRSRCRRGVQLFQIEAGPMEYDLAIRYGGLKEARIADKAAVNAALGRLLRLALAALLREADHRR
jgi:hypothetical protein